jgi:hypothetical protein
MKTRILGTLVATVQQTWRTKERKSEMQEKERRSKGSSTAKYYPSALTPNLPKSNSSGDIHVNIL